MNDINLLYVSIDAAAVTLNVLLAAQLMRQAPNFRVAMLILVLCTGVISYIISARDDYGVLVDLGYRLDLGALHPVFNILRNATGGAFMLLCYTIFRDGKPLPRALIALWIVQIFVEEPLHWFVGPDFGSDTARLLLFEALPSILQVTFLSFSLYWLLSKRDADLVMPRRRARVLIVIFYSIQAVASLLVERVAFGFVWVPYSWQYEIHVLMVFLSLPFVALLIFASMSPNTAIVLGAKRKHPAESAPAPPAENAEVARIRAAFEEEHIYRQAGLSVRDLAQHLALPEYRLRNLIHQHMGYRNFNALLHHYRLAEVCEALENPEQNTTPVLTLALSAGYQSINPFNRAFRELKQTTPTEYRRASQTVVDSSNSTPDPENGVTS